MLGELGFTHMEAGLNNFTWYGCPGMGIPEYNHFVLHFIT